MFATCSWPSLCSQSELQCFAPEFRRTLLFSKKRRFFCILNTLPFRALAAPTSQRFSPHIRPPHFASKVSYSAGAPVTRPTKFVNSFNSLLRRLRPLLYFIVYRAPYNIFRCLPRPQNIFPYITKTQNEACRAAHLVL